MIRPTFNVPPDVSGLHVFDAILNINEGGLAVSTVVGLGGVVDVFNGGRADFTTIHSGGVENVDGGMADFTTIYSGGVDC